MTGKGTTLYDELMQAARMLEDLPLENTIPWAARLRARAERVRELLDLAHKQKFNGGRRELARALTGADLGGAPEREGKP